MFNVEPRSVSLKVLRQFSAAVALSIPNFLDSPFASLSSSSPEEDVESLPLSPEEFDLEEFVPESDLLVELESEDGDSCLLLLPRCFLSDFETRFFFRFSSPWPRLLLRPRESDLSEARLFFRFPSPSRSSRDPLLLRD